MARVFDRYNELLWILGLTLLLFACAYFPIYRNYQRVATDRYYYGAEEFPIDQLGNLAYVREGYLGDVFATFNYSIFLGRHPSIVKFEYILIGHAARLLHLDPVLMFRITQFALSLLYVFTAYMLIRQAIVSKTGRIIAFAFVLFGTGIVWPSELFSFPEGVVYDVLVFVRMILAMPHYLLGGIFSLVSLYFLSKSLSNPGIYTSFIVASVLGLFASFFYAPNMVVIVSGFPLYLLFVGISGFLKDRRVRLNMTALSIFIAYAIIIAIPILYVRYIVGYYWQDLNTAKMEFLNPFVLTVSQYLRAIGLTYLLALFSLPWIIKRGNPLLVLLSTWVVMHPLGEFVISKVLHLNPIRYFLTPYFVVFGILSAVAVVEAVQLIGRAVPHLTLRKIYIGIVIVVLGSSIGTYQRTFHRAAICFCQPDVLAFGYPQKTVMESVRWLSENTNPNDVVLSGYHAGMLIPAFSGNSVYTSWWYKLIEPPSFPVVLDALSGFYRQTLSFEDAYTFLKRSHISYVYYSQEEHLLRPNTWGLQYPFLSEVYNRGEVIIYKIDQSYTQ